MDELLLLRMCMVSKYGLRLKISATALGGNYGDSCSIDGVRSARGIKRRERT
jgi:hypothetical protein